MKRPACNGTLTVSEGQGVEIDFGPKWRGWLDRGELDKILEREARLAGEGPSLRHVSM